MNNYRYKLERGSKKHNCPNCNKKTFVRYFDTETKEYLPELYGRCDRESKCLYHVNPYKDGYAKAVWQKEQGNNTNFKAHKIQKPINPQPQPQTVYFDYKSFLETLNIERYEKNTFLQNLHKRVCFPFDAKDIERVVQLYKLGTCANGAICFPFIDTKGNIRAIQVKQFDEANHTTHTTFLHAVLEQEYKYKGKDLPEWIKVYKEQEKKVTALFGEHTLTKYPNNPVYLFEAPKTAVYCSLYFGFPESSNNPLCLAVYNKSSFSFDKLKVLQGRFVYVFPDLSKDGNTFKEWETKAKQFEKLLPQTRFVFSNLLEQLATESDKNEGNDIADYLIKQDWRKYRKQKVKEPSPPEPESEPYKNEVAAFDGWLKQHPQGGIWEHENHRFKVSTKNKSVASVESEAPKTFLFSPPKQTAVPKYNWDAEIKELEAFYKDCLINQSKIKQLSTGITIEQPLQFIESHFSIINNNKGNPTFLPFLKRLQQLKTSIQNEN